MTVRMEGSKDTLRDRLARYRQIKISVIGRTSGRTISISVCSSWKETRSTSPTTGSTPSASQPPTIQLQKREAYLEDLQVDQQITFLSLDRERHGLLPTLGSSYCGLGSFNV